ncbi:type II RES/Xre toxin-antitoxin system antitoxin [Vaginella massiliensis]|uniref:type II RES/Xre toxin-antitoxin system antitoxin n=1 Tax=Vaginella massiliensis TaxID=1816680 RepID=UPI0019500015|nr:antitoxin Xre/MbcA/ParS toxin-binding domain-containing protein [Vaginella massiliensis]
MSYIYQKYHDMLTINEKLTYNNIEEKSIYDFISISREGIRYATFDRIVKNSPFSLVEWAQFLHISERTLLRYKTDKKIFDSIQSEKILQITMLIKRGTEIFETMGRFSKWLNIESVALGGITPKSLMDTSFGINLINDELTRIEYGIFS